MKDMKYILLRKKPIQILFDILGTDDEPKIMHNIGFNNKITWTHISKLVKKYEKEGLVSKEKKGRIVILTLTKKGYIVTTKFRALYKSLDGLEDERIS